MQSYFGTFHFGEFKPHNSNTWVMPIEVATVSIFTPFNFAVSLSLWNKGHANIKGFTVLVVGQSDQHNEHKVKWTRKSIALTCIETSMQSIYWRDGSRNTWTLDIDVALLRITINIDVQHAAVLLTLANNVVHQRRFPSPTSTLSALTRHRHIHRVRTIPAITSIPDSDRYWYSILNEIWCVGRGRRVMHDSMQYRSTSRSRALESWKFDHLQRQSLPQFIMGLANDYGFLN